jgi:DNA-binding transcriptional LysR family regulator
MPDLAPLYYLRTFDAVAARRSFTGAARALHLSQPAVSAHIRALERHYGGRLFEVRHRRVFLTAEGEALRAYTQRVFNLLADAERAVAATQGLGRGRLVVAASTTIGVYLLPLVLRRFRDDYPGIEISLLVGTSAQAVAHVRAEEAPLALVESEVDYPGLDVRPVRHDDLVLLAPPGHPWALRGHVSADDLRDQPVLRREAAAGTRTFLDHALARAGVRVRTEMELGSTEALKQAVIAGLGVAWVPRIAATHELAAGTVVEVATPDLELRRRFYRVTPAGARLPPAAEAFGALLRDMS